mmetsp:Transcript_5339/g.16172  ORF Transcript_5339/g.16172 Transcript_5339/m.16172 type:complete len:80 (+) Transcript_5339:1667-1906(+)|eukprot:359572-Chlamydomonas_euryale.AAC.5
MARCFMQPRVLPPGGLQGTPRPLRMVITASRAWPCCKACRCRGIDVAAQLMGLLLMGLPLAGLPLTGLPLVGLPWLVGA